MKEIPISKGETVLVDDEDYPFLSSIRWKLSNENGCLYATKSFYRCKKNRVSKFTTIKMHQFLLIGHGQESIDHVNGNGLDNRKCNLRPCSRSQNLCNQKLLRANNTTGYRGVKKGKYSYHARIQVRGKFIHIGCFKTPEEAAMARDIEARKLHGEFAQLNFRD